MTEKEQQFNQWFDQYANGVKVFEEADMKQAYLQGRADLEKENAELKEINTYTLSQLNLDNGELIIELTKAKELLNEFMRISKASDEDFEHDYSELIGEAEQFLDSEGK